MKTIDVYRIHFKEYCESMGGQKISKYEWASSEIFNLTTYDGSIDEMLVKHIIEICKVIMNRNNFEYIRNEANYITYILVCQLLDRFHWINWGTSIRGAWFETGIDAQQTPIIDTNLSVDKHGCDKVSFTYDNLKALIEFMEEDDVNNKK